jgi:hypothetical protein
MKELPEFWFLKLTLQNIRILGEWRTDKHFPDNLDFQNRIPTLSVLSDIPDRKGCRGYCIETRLIDSKYQEIFFEDFERLVLNKTKEIDIVLW